MLDDEPPVLQELEPGNEHEVAESAQKPLVAWYRYVQKNGGDPKAAAVCEYSVAKRYFAVDVGQGTPCFFAVTGPMPLKLNFCRRLPV